MDGGALEQTRANRAPPPANHRYKLTRSGLSLLVSGGRFERLSFMKTEDQVCSLDLAKKLKEVGVKQESLFYWNRQTKQVYMDTVPWNETAWVSAFTVSELGEMLREFFEDENGDPFDPPNELCLERAGQIWEPNYLAKLFIYLLENELITHLSRQ